ncbi:MAG: ThiF family adenylyltransferase [Phycisphaerales bacterium]|nr:ThiF family adenylyltransferase [Phycisphaerales bacterium]
MDSDSPALARYHRQMLLPEIGLAGQQRLAASHAMIIGLGALGCPAADLLCRAGVGRLTLIDRDTVETTNLQRQTLFDATDAAAGSPKAEAAARRLARINPTTVIHPIADDFVAEDAERVLSPHPRPGVLLDCTDNFEARYLINDVCVKLGVPLIYAGAIGTTAMSISILPGASACLRCVFPDPPMGDVGTCDTVGIFAPVSAMIASWQAGEAIKVLAGQQGLLSRSLLSIDAMDARTRQIDLSKSKRDDCPCCGLRRFEFLELRPEDNRAVGCDRPGEGAAAAGRVSGGAGGGGVFRRPARARVLCGRNAVQIAGSGDLQLDVLLARLAAVGRFERLGHAVTGVLDVGSPAAEKNLDQARSIGVESPIQLTIFADGRAIIGGTTDVGIARSLYARYIGG